MNILCAWVVTSKYHCLLKETGLPRWLGGKNSPANAGDEGSISVLGKSPGSVLPTQFCCEPITALKNKACLTTTTKKAVGGKCQNNLEE